MALSEFATWAGSVLGTTVVQSHQSAPPPALPYLLVDLVSVGSIRENPEMYQWSLTGETNSEGNLEKQVVPIIQDEYVVQVQYRGDNGLEQLLLLESASHVPEKQMELSPIVVHEFGVVSDLPEFFNETWEKRAAVTVTLHKQRKHSFVAETIEQVTTEITAQ